MGQAASGGGLPTAGDLPAAPTFMPPSLAAPPTLDGAPALPAMPAPGGAPALPATPTPGAAPTFDMSALLRSLGGAPSFNPPALGAPPTADGTPPPQYQQPAKDPLMDILMRQSEEQNKLALMHRARNDTSSLLARYGSRLAMAGKGTGSPLLAR